MEKATTISPAHIEHLEDDPHSAALQDNPDTPEKLSWATIWSILFLALAFVGPLSCGFVLPTAILVSIGTDLGDTSHIVWIPGGWSIASSVSFSIAGSLSDIFGRRNIILFGESLAIVGCIVGATAKNTITLVAGSTIIGFSCGIIFVGYAGIPELLPNKWRNVGLSITELLCGLPWTACSVLIGNALATHATWRWCYYIGIIYAVLSLIGTAIVYFPPSHPQGDSHVSRWEEIKSLDYIGILFYTTGLTSFLLGLTWAGSEGHPWKGASVIAPIVLGILFFVGCFVYDFSIAKRPFFPLSLFRKWREFTTLLILVFVSGMIYYSMSGLLPQGTLYMFTNDPVKIGIIQLPNGIAQLIGSAFMPAISHKIKHIKVQIVVAIVLQTVFVAAYSTAIPHHKAAWMALQIFGQGCFAYITLLCYFTASLHVPLRELGLAAGLIGTFRSCGGSVGNAVFNTIITSTVSQTLSANIAAAATKVGFSSSGIQDLIPAVMNAALGVPGAFNGITGATAEVQEATSIAFKETYAHAFKLGFWATIPFGVLAIIAACFVEDPSPYLTNHTAVHLERHVGTGLMRGLDNDKQELQCLGTPADEHRTTGTLDG